jgi:hypothetical protein
MAGRPRVAKRPALHRRDVPPAPDTLSDWEKKVWERLTREVTAVGTYDEGCYTAFYDMVRKVALAETLDLSALDTPATRIMAMASSALGRFGLTPADRGKVSANPLPQGSDPDSEFSGDGPHLSVVPKPWEQRS